MIIALLRGLAVGSLLAITATVEAQPVLGSSPSAPVVPPSLRDATNASPFALPQGIAEVTTPFQWGMMKITPRLADRFVYSDGIQATPGHPANSYINSLSMGLLVDIGRNWTLDYTPTWLVYTNPVFKNSVDHAVLIAGGAQSSEWLVQFAQGYHLSHMPRIETGRQTGQESFGTSLNLSHRFDSHLSIEIGFNQDLQFIEDFPNNYDWATEDWLVYNVATRLSLSVGVRVGFTDFDPGAYMTYSQPKARVRWRVTDKLTLSVQGGRDYRKIHTTGSAAQNSPTYAGAIQYQPFDQTKLTLNADRKAAPSYLTNSLTESKGWGIELEQRLLGHFTLTTGVSKLKTQYFGKHTAFIPNYSYENVVDSNGNITGVLTTTTYTPVTVVDLRNDSTRAFHVRLSTPFLRRGTFTVLYEEAHNVSDLAGYSLDSHQVGCELGFKF